eukprot:5215492-Prymnesium_polylepis.1
MPAHDCTQQRDSNHGCVSDSTAPQLNPVTPLSGSLCGSAYRRAACRPPSRRSAARRPAAAWPRRAAPTPPRALGRRRRRKPPPPTPHP